MADLAVLLAVDYSPVLNWSGELTAALLGLVVVTFIIAQIR